jgi:hypothetical protein
MAALMRRAPRSPEARFGTIERRLRRIEDALLECGGC